MLDSIDLSSLPDDRTRALVGGLLNLIETVMADLRTAQAENQRLRDELNRLKGEQGQPAIKRNPPLAPPLDHSSEQERKEPRQRVKRAKNATIAIDREQTLTLEPATLPPDAEFKGYEDVIVQDVVLHTDNICFHKAKYYAASTGRTYLAPLPAGYSGEFGPGIKALTLVFYYACHSIFARNPGDIKPGFHPARASQ